MELGSNSNLKTDNGVAGLTIILSIVVFLFVIGLLIAIFAIMSNELEDATDEGQSSTEPNGPNISTPNNLTYTAFANSTILALDDISCGIYNFTNHSDGSLIGTGNYTVGGTGNCYYILTDAAVADGTINGSGFNVSYTLSWSTETVASGTIENTSVALGGAVDWFDIVLVIGFMVVLILLVVLIINTIKGGGLLQSGNGGMSSSGNIGSA